MYDDILVRICVTNQKLLHFKLSKSGHILDVDKTCLPGQVTYCVVQIFARGKHWGFW